MYRKLLVTGKYYLYYSIYFNFSRGAVASLRFVVQFFKSLGKL